MPTEKSPWEDPRMGIQEHVPCHPKAGLPHYCTRKHTSVSCKGTRNQDQAAAPQGRATSPLSPADPPAAYRGDDRGHAERLLERQGPLLLGGGADDVAVHAAGFLRKPLQEVGGIQNFSLCLLQRLSLNSGRKGTVSASQEQQQGALSQYSRPRAGWERLPSQTPGVAETCAESTGNRDEL